MSHIDADTYTGPHSLLNRRARSDVFTARELAAKAQGDLVVLWVHSGTVGGQSLYLRLRFMPQSDGSLYGYDGDGVLNAIYRASRRVRVLTKKA